MERIQIYPGEPAVELPKFKNQIHIMFVDHIYKSENILANLSF